MLWLHITEIRKEATKERIKQMTKKSESPKTDDKNDWYISFKSQSQ